MIRPIVILGKGPEAADLALRRVLRFKERAGPLLVLDWIGRGAPLLHHDNEGGLSKRPVVWCDLANRQRPLGVFGLRRSDALHGLLMNILVRLRELSHASFRDEALAWAADVGVKLADEGEVGLAAWYHTLRRPEVKRWFPGAETTADEREALARTLSWALRFPSVYTVSEAPNRVALSTALHKTQTTWIEIPVEHFEPIEHKLVTLLVDTALWDALYRSNTAAQRSEAAPMILQLFPDSIGPGLTERLKGTGSGVRHVAVFAVSADRAPSAALKDWIDCGADIWMLGQRGLPVTSLAPWLDDAARNRLSTLGAGDLWLRSGASGQALVVKFRQQAPAIPVPWRFRLYAARRRRPLAVAQTATALERTGPRAGRLYDRLCDKALLRTAWLRVAQGRPDSHGIDGVTIARFKASVDAELDSLLEDLESRQYRARPFRSVLIPKLSGGHRQLRISCVRDRVAQTACLSLLEPIFEATFSHFSFAFRPRRSAHHAVALAQSFVAAGGKWAVTADIERCFDTIDHDLLLERVASRAPDPVLIALLRHWLTADVLDFRDLVPMDLGVPQGSPISPLLANVYLTPLDRHFEERRLDFVRYADDILIFAPDEPRALEALRAMAAFLHDPLRLNLKPAKTHHACLTEGVDFLGFHLLGGAVTIQPEKLDRVTSALHASLTVLGAPHTSFLERMKTLGRINSLIRGFRAYFSLPDELPILPQLRHLDRTVDELAEETLPKELRDDPAWLTRERFTTSAPEDDATSPPIVHNVYPEERVSSGPLNWMAKHGHPESSTPAVAATPPASAESPADADTHTERAAIVEHEGRVYVMTHGAYVTESDGALVVKHRRAEIFRKPLDQVSLLFLQGQGTSLSLSLASECAKRDVALVVAQPIGAPLGVLNPVNSARAHLRGRQVLRRNDPDVIRAGLHMLGAKAGNQAATLRYFAKYRAKTDTELYRRLVAASDEVRGLGRRLEQVDAGGAGVRAMAMGFEGQAAATYWSHLASLLPAGAGFKGRVTRDAGDPVNQAINYVYGMLYGEVWRALVKAGLDPYFGIMHGSERDQGSLVFDLIEEFRAPFADRLVVALVSRGLKIATPGADGLRLRARRVLARSFIRSWTRKIRWRGRHVAPAGILQHQAGALVKLINGDGDYRPFRMRW